MSSTTDRRCDSEAGLRECGNCRHGLHEAIPGYVPAVSMTCRFYPEPKAKRPDDLCGQHEFDDGVAGRSVAQTRWEYPIDVRLRSRHDALRDQLGDGGRYVICRTILFAGMAVCERLEAIWQRLESSDRRERRSGDGA